LRIFLKFPLFKTLLIPGIIFCILVYTHDARILGIRLNRPAARSNLITIKCLREKLQAGLHGRLVLVTALPDFNRNNPVRRLTAGYGAVQHLALITSRVQGA
jgi:hypothetical protein